MGALGIDDESFWSDPFIAREVVLDRLDIDDATGIILDAPTRVRLDLRDDVPLAGARRYPGDVARAQRFHERAVLVVVRAGSNEVFAARAFPWKEPAPLPNDAPPRDPADGPLTIPTITDFFELFARERIPALPLRATTLHAVILCGDERSNAVAVSLEDAPEPNARVRTFLEAHRSPGYPRAVSPSRRPGESLPTYTKTPESPAQPPFGVALEVPSEAPAAGPCVVRASFSLPVLERETVRSFDAHFDRFARLVGAPWIDVGDPDAVAVLAITLVVTTDDDAPATLRLDVPVYDVAEGIGRGHFAVDLRAWDEMHRAPGRYRVWAFSGAVVVGPMALTLTA